MALDYYNLFCLLSLPRDPRGISILEKADINPRSTLIGSVRNRSYFVQIGRTLAWSDPRRVDTDDERAGNFLNISIPAYFVESEVQYKWKPPPPVGGVVLD